MAELREKGFAFKMDTAAYTEDGKLKNIYLEDEFGGFAIPEIQKKRGLSERRMGRAFVLSRSDEQTPPRWRPAAGP